MSFFWYLGKKGYFIKLPIEIVNPSISFKLGKSALNWNSEDVKASINQGYPALILVPWF